MPVDQDLVKKALDAFEDDEFTDAKEILQGEIRKARDEFLKGKLGIGGEKDGTKEGSEEGKEEEGSEEGKEE